MKAAWQNNRTLKPIIRIILLPGVCFLSSCSISQMMAPSGEQIVFEEKLDQTVRVIPLSLSSKRGINFQMMEVSLVGDALDGFTRNHRIIASADVSCRKASGQTVFSKNDFTRSVFGHVALVQGESERIHRGVLRRESGGHYFDIRVSRLANEPRDFDLKVVFSEALPQGTMLRVRIFWSDGP